MTDVKLEKFFDIKRWEEMLEKGCQKGIDMGLLRQLCYPNSRLQLLKAITSGNYEIAPPHIAQIPKDNGDFREVYVNESIDRIFLSLYNDVLFEMFGHKIHPACKSYQKGIGCGKVVQEVSKNIASIKRNHIGYKLDLSKYFDSVKIEIIDQALDELDTGSPLDMIVKNYYHNDLVFDINARLINHYGSLKQGCAVASFLADYILRDIDEVMSKMVPVYYRYSDDLLLIGDNADEAIEYLKIALEQKGLSLNPKKVAPLYKDKFFTFLGFNICGDKITFSKKAIKSFQKEIEDRTINANYSTDVSIRKVMKYLYEGCKVGDKEYGWATRFLPIVNVTDDIKELNKFVMDCIRAVDSGKCKVGGLGENKQMTERVVCRGTGKNVSANRNKWNYKYGGENIDGYLTISTMQNALRMGQSVYESLLASVVM